MAKYNSSKISRWLWFPSKEKKNRIGGRNGKRRRVRKNRKFDEGRYRVRMRIEYRK